MLNRLLELYKRTYDDHFREKAILFMRDQLHYSGSDIYDTIENYINSPTQPSNCKLVDGEYFEELPSDVFYCNVCKEYHHLSNTAQHTMSDGNYCCDRALERGVVVKCKECGKLINTQNGYFNYDRKLCKDCYEELRKYDIKSYHDNPTLEYYDCKDGQNYKTDDFLGGYGVELEVDRGGERNDMSKDVIKLLQEEVYTMHDGSLSNGFEIITHPHTEKALYNMNWEETFRWLIQKGYRSHDVSTCGLHLHISRTLFNSEESIAKLVYFYNHFWTDLLKVSRRTDDRARRWAGRYSSFSIWGSADTFDMDDARKVVEEYNQRNIHDMRYRAVNLQKRQTVEIRLMRGTLNYDSFMACLDFMITTAKNSNTVTDVNDISQWLNGISDNTKEYLSTRKAFGYPPVEETEEVDDCYNMSQEEKEELRRRVCAL